MLKKTSLTIIKKFNMKLHTLLLAGLMIAAPVVTSCGDGGQNDPIIVDNPDKDDDSGNNNGSGDNGNTNQPTQSSYNEQYRPQIHFTPAANWMNDPNGMVYLDGTWHLFYQYNPYANDWGNMSWGHATSADLVHWTEQPVAITKCAQGDIFSGSCVIDKDNTAGFGKNTMIAIYTANGERQQQNIAYSTDGGKTFSQYSGNPVISNTSRDHFRDPKVFWHSESQQWVMSLALGTEYGVEFWGSKNLKDWQMLSQFKMPSVLSTGGVQWECPDLIRMKLDGKDQWVLIVSVNPGGPNGGSGTMYFVGDWDGKEFKALSQDYPLWVDTGADNYAGVTWSNTPDGSCKFIGWMNNWNYAGASPVSPWRSAMTISRDLSLKNINGQILLCSRPVENLDKIAGSWTDVEQGDYSSKLNGCACSQVRVEIPSLANGSVVLSNENGEKYEIKINKAAEMLISSRDKNTGNVSFNGTFSLPGVKSKLYSTDKLTLDIIIDQSSVEIFSEDGSLVQTNLVYPKKAYHKVSLSGVEGKIKVRPLKSVWL